MKSSDQVVVISTAHGLKFVDSKLAYHSMKLDDIISEHPNPPIELPADYRVVRDQMLREIDSRFSGGGALPGGGGALPGGGGAPPSGGEAS